MNLLMKRVGANVILPVMVVLWGIVCACQGGHFPLVPPPFNKSSLHSLGAVHSYRSLLLCRFFLGAIEGITHQHEFDSILKASLAGLSPGIILLFSTFYRRHTMQLRFAMMYSVTSLAGALSGLLAFGIENLNGKLGIAGWQWIFIVVSVLCSVYCLLYVLTFHSGGSLHLRLWASHNLSRPCLAQKYQVSY